MSEQKKEEIRKQDQEFAARVMATAEKVAEMTGLKKGTPEYNEFIKKCGVAYVAESGSEDVTDALNNLSLRKNWKYFLKHGAVTAGFAAVGAAVGILLVGVASSKMAETQAETSSDENPFSDISASERKLRSTK